ncbi:MAG: hypothetical protein KAH95_09905 [Spirochaetales bacterium]|nr:hypothetical protein [Spirochaetales bacterium]
MKNNVEAKLKPQWKEVEKARVICEEFLEEKEYSTDTIDSITMIISELVENAVKYGDFVSIDDGIGISLLTGKKIIIEVKCPIIKTKNHHFKRLDRTIQWIRGHQNPFEAYIEKLKVVSVRSKNDNESGLGLFRIAYEGMAVLDFYVSEDGIISVSAVYELDE